MKIISTTYKITTLAVAFAFAFSAVNPAGLMEWCKEMMSMHASMEMHHDMDSSEMNNGECEKAAESSTKKDSTEECHSMLNCVCFDTPFNKKLDSKLISKSNTGKVIYTFHKYIQTNLFKADTGPPPFLSSSYSPSYLFILNQSFLI